MELEDFIGPKRLFPLRSRSDKKKKMQVDAAGDERHEMQPDWLETKPEIPRHLVDRDELSIELEILRKPQRPLAEFTHKKSGWKGEEEGDC